MARNRDQDNAEYDSEELSALFIDLGERASIIRSYCIYVLDGGLSLVQWRKADKRAPSGSSWTQRYSEKGKYWGKVGDFDQTFRDGVKAYWTLMQKAQHTFMLREAQRAQAIMQRSATQAADRIKQLAMESDNHMVALQASKFVYSQQVRAIVTDDEQTWDEAETTASEDDGSEGEPAE